MQGNPTEIINQCPFLEERRLLYNFTIHLHFIRKIKFSHFSSIPYYPDVHDSFIRHHLALHYWSYVCLFSICYCRTCTFTKPLPEYWKSPFPMSTTIPLICLSCIVILQFFLLSMWVLLKLHRNHPCCFCSLLFAGDVTNVQRAPRVVE